MDIQIWVLAFIMIFMLHNLEEIITVERWMKKTYPQIRSKIPSFAQSEIEKNKDITSAQFAVVVLALSVLASAFLLVAVLTEQYYLFLGIALVFAVNIFSHPLQSLFLRCYTPGVVTSIVLVIPFYSLFFYQFYNTDLFSMSNIIGAIIVIIIFIPVFLISHKLGKMWK
ncbi:HXXEE domain-containing protein [Ornithinibacillus halotolerans]|uniref:HXXEE domain-containing protein n=1 Tax=Ornithinibacillus halotolerans TaxID=1274357 RepID=A0A916S4B8_9BACI|nr:HXXEE domain-containing protein [Ornithinibacillus halotolerans]GGA80480.1 hypothetical protein GCM10008025_24860 [Ornithinibacillus halotolerans]